MNTSVHKGWFTRHRSWEDYSLAAIGVLIVLSPIVAVPDVSAAVVITTGLVGVVIAMIALLEVMALQRWEEGLELVCGVWVVASPFVFGYGGMLRIGHFVLGAAVLVLALLEIWQDRNRKLAE